MELKGLTIACLGDSITQGVGATSNEKIWHQVLKENCGIKECINYGISGTRFARQSIPSECPSFDQDFISRVNSMRDDVDAVLVFGGTNDYGHGDAPFGEFSDRGEDTFSGACHVLMQKLIKKYPDKPIVFMTPLHRTDDDKPSERTQKSQILKDFVDVIKQTAQYYSIPIIDLYGASGMCSAVEVQNKLYFADGLHPNDVGHAKLASVVESFLKNM
ncbi:MAG: SGNH/GDSL hydrolase family protein [Clostridia bacterium]|nr:SGNH/GDSL hydrolase family protein [Clostridia bacterium]